MDFLNNKNIRCNSVKSSVLFAVTVPYTKISKEEAYDELKIFCIKLIISKEKHIKQNTYHHHLYFRTSQKFTIDNIKLIISTIYEIESPVLNKKVPIYEEGTIYIGTCRNERQYMKYITKEDKAPAIKGVDHHEMSFQFNALKWAERTEKFKLHDSFVLDNCLKYKFLEKLHAEIRMEKMVGNMNELTVFDKKNLFSNKFSPCFLSQWALKLIEWLNDWIIRGRRSKDAQLYLWGKPNQGKTRFVRHVLTNCFKNENYNFQVFSPTPNDKNFGWQGFSEELHKIMIIDEFEMSHFDTSQLKQALAGESLVINRKGESAVFKNFEIPAILISNHPPPALDYSEKYVGIIERLQVIEADMPIY